MLTGAGSLIALAALGGFLGGVLRYVVTDLTGRLVGARFPWGTLVVNATGSAAIGALAGVLFPAGGPGMDGEAARQIWAGLAVGMLGAYTTVSSVSIQTMELWREGRQAAAAANLLGTTALCLGAAAFGFALVTGGVP